MTSPLYEQLAEIGRQDLGAWVDSIQRVRTPSGVVVKLRFWLVSGDFLDVFASAEGRYAFHFEGRETGGRIYRHDNAPHGKAHGCATYPRHCRQGSEKNIVDSHLPSDLPEAFRVYCKMLLIFLSEDA